MGHADLLLAILEREERRKAAAEERRLAITRLRRPLRDRIELAEATVEHTAFLMARSRRWYAYFATPRPRCFRADGARVSGRR